MGELVGLLRTGRARGIAGFSHRLSSQVLVRGGGRCVDTTVLPSCVAGTAADAPDTQPDAICRDWRGAMKLRARRALSVAAAMLSVVSVAFSCSYGDDEDDEKDDDKKAEALDSVLALQRPSDSEAIRRPVELGLQAARQGAQGEA
ncbi:MAG TPA: hypothetical protein PKA13_17845 [Geminicoccaceae bacterium]|nr:hypothetical protein [Geminicoccus sp.]HMU51643.1 hypothetical protein [Geminicoccaceae bacterium]